MAKKRLSKRITVWMDEELLELIKSVSESNKISISMTGRGFILEGFESACKKTDRKLKRDILKAQEELRRSQ